VVGSSVGYRVISNVQTTGPVTCMGECGGVRRGAEQRGPCAAKVLSVDADELAEPAIPSFMRG
jgi:hypothetical protein